MAVRHSAPWIYLNSVPFWSEFAGRVEPVMRKLNYAAYVNVIMPHTRTERSRTSPRNCKYPAYGGEYRFDIQHIEAYLILQTRWETGVPKPPRPDPKSLVLARDGALNPHPEAVRDPLFTTNPFFDPKDLVQVRYEMVRRHDAEGMSVTDLASSFGVSRPTFYKVQSTLATSGLAGLVPHPRGPKGAHKVSAEVVAFITNLKAEQPELTTSQCLDAIKAQFGVVVHRRSLERAMTRKKKSQVPAQ